jgi:hypothetical protein
MWGLKYYGYLDTSGIRNSCGLLVDNYKWLWYIIYMDNNKPTTFDTNHVDQLIELLAIYSETGSTDFVLDATWATPMELLGTAIQILDKCWT